MGIELTGCDDCDKSLAEKNDLCTKHKLEMITAQVSYWMRQWEETLEVYTKEIEELKQKIRKEKENDKEKK